MVSDAHRAENYGPINDVPRQMSERSQREGPKPPADPRQVTDAIVAVIAAPHGRRPLRVVVDPGWPEVVEQINTATGQMQMAVLERLGIGQVAAVTVGPGTAGPVDGG